MAHRAQSTTGDQTVEDTTIRLEAAAAGPVGLEHAVAVPPVHTSMANRRPASRASAEPCAEYQGTSQPMKSR